MFGIDITVIAFVALVTLGVAGLAYVLMFDRVAMEAKQEKRLKSINNREQNKVARAESRVADAAKRRKSVQDSLKELEEKQKEKHGKEKPNLKQLIRQAGLKITVKQFWILSGLCGLATAFIAMLSGANLYVAGAALIVGFLGLPRWILGYIRKKRFKQFLEEFPNAVDVIVRGVKAGLPLNDCLTIIARESKEPVRTEFARVIETQHMGVPLTEAVGRLYKNIPVPEANFFGIVISIQQQAGGNLSEALSNLSGVLRDRKKMQAKIRAMSAEAKASAGIIGSLPFAVATLVYLTTPDYIMILFNTMKGNIVLVCAGTWMCMGILVMKKMINFDF
ncbi:MAG: type II secretion system F family protein [Nitratireductor sp.]|nr:type II secretion system F family protein [Nitratireductor sp.]